MKAYYARCMSIYGKPQEARDVQLLEYLGHSIVPFPSQSSLNHRKARGENVMETVFKKLVISSEILFFRGLPSGKITAGVGKEIEWANKANIPVLELPSMTGARTISIEETRAYLREVMR
jgi:hypothetical protein